MTAATPIDGDFRIRFALRDVFALMTACAIAATLISRWSKPALPEAAFDTGWPSGIGGTELIVWSILLGTILAGPIVIAFRCCADRRIGRLSEGELLWLLPNIEWAACYLAMQLLPADGVLAVAAMTAITQITGTFFAIARIYEHMPKSRPATRWTDMMGNASCILATAIGMVICRLVMISVN